MSSFKTIRNQAQQERQKAKVELLEKIRVSLARHATAADYLARIAGELNAQGVFTLTGKPWTTRNLWQFLATNGEDFADLKPAAKRRAAKTGPDRPSVWQQDAPADLEQLLEWAMRYKKVGVVPVAIPDPLLLERVERMLERENLSFSGVIQELLTRWLARKDQRIPEHKKFARPPICMSLLRNSGEHVVITMDPSQRKKTP
jgi:hypothetical protein